MEMRRCAIRATQNFLLTNAFRLLLLPRRINKSFVTNEKTGRGGGDRTHDLRLKRPLLYH
jgi:hypothetical protein